MSKSEPVQLPPVVFGGGFSYAPVPVLDYQEDHVTLFGSACDVTGSMRGHMPAVQRCLMSSIASLIDSPFADHLLVRVTEFDDPVRYAGTKHGTVREIFPFTKLGDLMPDNLPKDPAEKLAVITDKVSSMMPKMVPDGNTTLLDAIYDGIVTLDKQGREFRRERIKTNAILVVKTDGVDNASVKSIDDIRQALADLQKGSDAIESIMLILIGIIAAVHAAELAELKEAVGFDHYIDAGDATPAALAKLQGYIVESVSSTSMAAGSGKKSTAIRAQI